jgi:putative ABC transport system permease protein
MKRPGIRRLFSMPLGRRERWEREVEEEILTHLTIRAERLMETGMAPQQAKDEAIRRFGGLDQGRQAMVDAAHHREEFMRRKETLGELRQDVAFAMRTLGRNKGWATVAIVTLALGIGATTAVWSAATTLLLHPLSYPGADRVVNVTLLPTTGNSTGVDVTMSPERKQIVAWRDKARSFEAIEPYVSATRMIGLPADAEDVVVTQVMPTFAAFAGERPIAGRNFTEVDLREGAPVGLLGEALWRTRFASSKSVIGSTLLIAGKPTRIIGVMPATLKTPRIGGRAPGVWVPLDLAKGNAAPRVIARLRQGIDAEAARRELDSVSVRTGIYSANTLPFRAVLATPGEGVSFRDSLVMLTGAVLLVLLVAAANVAHLLLARAVNRQREVAIRTALGASRWRLVRQLMTESFLLCTVGVAIGVALGAAMLRAMVKFRPASLQELESAHLDLQAMLAVVAVALLCAVAFGAVAALAAGSRASAASLRSGVVAMFSKSGERFRSSLVVTEMALSGMLLVGAVLLVRSVIALQQTDLGFDPVNVHAIVPDFPQDQTTAPATKLASMRELATKIAAVPGVSAVTVTDAVPSYRNFSVGSLEVEGKPRPDTRTTSFIDVGSITPSYFTTLGAHLVEGRVPSDSSATSQEIVINEGFARRQWGSGRAVGRRMRIVYQGEPNNWLTVVGVVHDILSMGPVGDKAAPFLYMPLKESGTIGVVYRTTGNPAIVAQVLAISKAQFPGIRINQHAAEKTIENTLAPSRFIMILMTGFTILAMILAAIGLYGMMAYAVAQRTREIGIRMALGATREQIARTVVGRGALLGVAGATLGLGLAVWGTRIIEGSLYGVKRFDGPSFLIGGGLLVMIAILSSLLPMRRAVAVDPVTAIRAD